MFAGTRLPGKPSAGEWRHTKTLRPFRDPTSDPPGDSRTSCHWTIHTYTRTRLRHIAQEQEDPCPIKATSIRVFASSRSSTPRTDSSSGSPAVDGASPLNLIRPSIRRAHDVAPVALNSNSPSVAIWGRAGLVIATCAASQPGTCLRLALMLEKNNPA